jgi:hypothetical protein
MKANQIVSGNQNEARQRIARIEERTIQLTTISPKEKVVKLGKRW